MPDDSIAQLNPSSEPAWRTIIEFTLPAVTDHASQAVQQVIAAMAEFQLSPARLEQLTLAMVDAIHNAVLQNDRLRLELPILIRMSVAALADRDTACCWGFFVITRTADRRSATDSQAHHAIELFLYRDSARPHQTTA